MCLKAKFDYAYYTVNNGLEIAILKSESQLMTKRPSTTSLKYPSSTIHNIKTMHNRIRQVS